MCVYLVTNKMTFLCSFALVLGNSFPAHLWKRKIHLNVCSRQQPKTSSWCLFTNNSPYFELRKTFFQQSEGKRACCILILLQAGNSLHVIIMSKEPLLSSSEPRLCVVSETAVSCYLGVCKILLYLEIRVPALVQIIIGRPIWISCSYPQRSQALTWMQLTCSTTLLRCMKTKIKNTKSNSTI